MPDAQETKLAEISVLAARRQLTGTGPGTQHRHGPHYPCDVCGEPADTRITLGTQSPRTFYLCNAHNAEVNERARVLRATKGKKRRTP